MIEHKELEQRILAELEEAWEETVGTLINTITERTGDPAEVHNCFAAISSLIDRDLVRMSNSRGADRRLEALSLSASLEVLNALQPKFTYSSVQRLWQDNSAFADGPPYREYFPHVLPTEEGKAVGISILTGRGYQWWRVKS